MGGNSASAGIPLYTVTTNMTTTLEHQNGMLYHPATETATHIITIDNSVNYPLGTSITFDNDIGAGALTITTSATLVLVGTAGTVGDKTLASGGRATAVKISNTRWRIGGVLLT
jgi:hypothetical protein